MAYKQSQTYNRAKYLENLLLQPVSSKGNLQVVGESPTEDSSQMKLSGCSGKCLRYSHDYILCNIYII